MFYSGSFSTSPTLPELIIHIDNTALLVYIISMKRYVYLTEIVTRIRNMLSAELETARRYMVIYHHVLLVGVSPLNPIIGGFAPPNSPPTERRPAGHPDTGGIAPLYSPTERPAASGYRREEA